MRSVALTAACTALIVSACADDSERMTGAGAGNGAGAAANVGGGPDDGGGAGGCGMSVTQPVWTSCEGLYECATLEVPVDYDAPCAGAAMLNLMRTPPLVDAQGTVFLLPTGPGIAVKDMMLTGVGLSQMGWNAVGFDPRGVENSTPVTCGDDAAVDALASIDTSPDTVDERAALEAAAESWVEDCLANTDAAFLPRVDSRSVALDLERVREVLGIEEVNIFALSHGTHAAMRYAQLFPERVRGIALDSPPATPLETEQAFRSLALGYQDALERFFLWCASGCEGAPACFGSGGTVQDVRAAFDGALAEIESLNLGRPADRALYQLLKYGSFSDLSDALLTLEAGSSAELLSYYALPPLHADGSYWNFLAARTGIWNADHIMPPNYSRADFEALRDGLRVSGAAQSVDFVSSEAPFWHAGYYSVAPARLPEPYAAPNAPPFLILAGEHDPEALLIDVETLRDGLGNGSYLVIRHGDGHVQSDLDPTDCTRDGALAYLQSPNQPPAVVSCE